MSIYEWDIPFQYILMDRNNTLIFKLCFFLASPWFIYLRFVQFKSLFEHRPLVNRNFKNENFNSFEAFVLNVLREHAQIRRWMPLYYILNITKNIYILNKITYMIVDTNNVKKYTFFNWKKPCSCDIFAILTWRSSKRTVHSKLIKRKMVKEIIICS